MEPIRRAFLQRMRSVWVGRCGRRLLRTFRKASAGAQIVRCRRILRKKPGCAAVTAQPGKREANEIIWPAGGFPRRVFQGRYHARYRLGCRSPRVTLSFHSYPFSPSLESHRLRRKHSNCQRTGSTTPSTIPTLPKRIQRYSFLPIHTNHRLSRVSTNYTSTKK